MTGKLEILQKFQSFIFIFWFWQQCWSVNLERAGQWFTHSQFMLQDANQLTFGPWMRILKIKASIKVVCFMWLVKEEAWLTKDNLQRRGIQLVNRCYMCGIEAESVNHLFLHCSISTQIWQMCLKFWDQSGLWKKSCWTSFMLEASNRKGLSKNLKKTWDTIPACIRYGLFGKRNRRCNEDKRALLLKLNLFALWFLL